MAWAIKKATREISREEGREHKITSGVCDRMWLSRKKMISCNFCGKICSWLFNYSWWLDNMWAICCWIVQRWLSAVCFKRRAKRRLSKGCQSATCGVTGDAPWAGVIEKGGMSSWLSGVKSTIQHLQIVNVRLGCTLFPYGKNWIQFFSLR